MKQISYKIITECVMAGAPALAKEVIDDLNATLEKCDKLSEPTTECKEAKKKKEN